MADVTAQDVKSLRDATGAGMMDAKKALIEAEGDAEAAAQILREKGLAKAATRTDRENAEGSVAVVAEGNKAVLVHIKCETDFSAKSEQFQTFVDSLTANVFSNGVDAVDGYTQELDDLRLSIKENVEVGKVEVVEAEEGNLIDVYLHKQDGRGVNGVIVEGKGVDQETLHQVALHIAFAKPAALTREEVPEEAIEKERAALLEITKAEGEPEQAWEKIVEGRLTGWFRESVLLDQGLHGDKTSVRDSLGGGEIVRFVQAYLGG